MVSLSDTIFYLTILKGVCIFEIKNMRVVLVTGANGQLGTMLQLYTCGLKQDVKYLFFGRDELDITNIDSVRMVVEELCEKEGLTDILNLAAYTSVANAEGNIEIAKKVNCDGVYNLGVVAKENGLFLINIGTDYIYNGYCNTPIKEGEGFNPLNVYGKTKAEGILMLEKIWEGYKNYEKDYCTIVTSWIFSEVGTNFVNGMYYRATHDMHTAVVIDQIGSPTYAKDLCVFINHIYTTKDGVIRLKDLVDKTIHYSCDGIASWYDIAKVVYDEFGSEKIKPCTTDEFNEGATNIVVRPKYSVLDKSKLLSLFPEIKLRHWSIALSDCIKQIKKPRS